MIRIENKRDCCGCEACVNICPKHCIFMKEDKEGFLYPQVDEQSCINCGKCEKACPVIQQDKERVPIKVVATFNDNLPVRMVSSSGGVFTQLAEYVIRNGGVVFGAMFDTQWGVIHNYVDKIEDLLKFRGSKYLQSHIGDCYKIIKQMLENNRIVLFSGTPCQISALNRFLNNSYENLITVDIACHGVPSPGVWKLYLKELSERILPGSSVMGVSFRDKKNGWKNYNVSIDVKDGKKQLQYSIPFYKDWYMRSFLKNLIMRPSCSSCPVRNGKSGSDITIADFWGIENIYPDMDDDKGTSIVLINTLKGNAIFEELGNKQKIVDYSVVCKYNPCFKESFTSHPMRDYFFRKTAISKKVIPAMKDCLSDKFSMRVKRKLLGLLFS